MYAVGNPTAESPVLVTANYKLTFDVVRSRLDGLDAWLMVLDTRGINVWCAAGKRTFSTEEVIGRIEFDRLADVVFHRRLILPQLGAPGVSAHEVKKATGFTVKYGPVRATDIPAYLAAGLQTTPEMREVTFSLRERAALTPVELSGAWKYILAVLAAFIVFGLFTTHPLTAGGFFRTLSEDLAPFAAGVIGGAVLTPLLLPWLPPRMFAAKGAIIGIIVGAGVALLIHPTLMVGLAVILVTVAITSYMAMNFTGSTPFTSLSGVEREMRRWMPIQAGAAVIALLAVLFRGII